MFPTCYHDYIEQNSELCPSMSLAEWSERMGMEDRFILEVSFHPTQSHENATRSHPKMSYN